MADEQNKKAKKTRRAGQIITRGEKTHLIRVFIGRDASGKRQYHNHTFRGTKKDAQTWLNSALRRLDMGEPIEQSAMLCSEFFEKWLTTAVKPRVRPRSYFTYQDKVNTHIIPALGKKRLSDVRPLDLQTFYGNLQEQGLSATSIRYVHGLLSNAFKQAVRWQMLRQNPAQMVDPPRQTKAEMTAMTSEQARAFLQAAADRERYYPLFVFLLTTGCRPGEAMGVKWSDVDWQAGSVTINRSLYWQRPRGGWVLSEPKTQQSRRTILLGDNVVKALAYWKRQQAEERLKAGSEWGNHNFAFTKLDGEPLHLDPVRKVFKACLTKAKLPEFRLYDTRHSCASILMAEGTNPKIVSERLGHSQVSMTLGTYSHVTKGLQSDATQKLENALFENGWHTPGTQKGGPGDKATG